MNCFSRSRQIQVPLLGVEAGRTDAIMLFAHEGRDGWANQYVPESTRCVSSTLAIRSVLSGPPAVIARRDSRGPARLGFRTVPGGGRRSSETDSAVVRRP